MAVVGLVGLMGATISCAALRKPAPAPFAAPPVTVTFTAFAGTPLSGSTATAVSIPPPQEAWRVRIRLTAVERPPAVDAKSSIGGKAALIVASRGGEPVSPSDRLFGGARWIDGTVDLTPAAVGQSAGIDDRSAALVAGTTLFLTAGDSIDTLDPVTGGKARRLVGVMIYRPAAAGQAAAGDGAYRVGVELQDLYTPPPPYRPAEDEGGKKKGGAAAAATTEPAPEEAKPTPTLTREVAVVDRALQNDADTFTLMLPVQFSGTAAKAVVVQVDVRRWNSSDADQGELVSAVEKELLRSRGLAARQPGVTAFGAAASSAADVALASLDDQGRRRNALVYLSGQTGAKLCEDASLVADEKTLDVIATGVQRAILAAGARPEGAALGWLLDHATFVVLGDQLANERLSPELAAVLTSYAGEAGRHAASIEVITQAAGNSREAFDAQLVAENLIFLEDVSPASRVRAYDWLAGRKIAPAGYKPLDSAKARRVALDRALNPSTSTTQPSSGPTDITTSGGQP